MSVSWPTDTYSSADIARGDFAADQAVSTSRAAALANVDLILCRHAVPAYFAEATRTNTAYATMASFYLYIPSWAASCSSLQVWLDGKVTGGTGTWKVVDNATSTSSTEDTVTGTTYATEGPVTLTIASTWLDTVRTIDVQGKCTSANTISLKSVDRYTVRFID